MAPSPIHEAAGAAVSGRYFDNIVIVAMENQNYADVMGSGSGSPDAPYIAGLLPQGATIPNYHGNSVCGGSSENAYIQLESAQDWGCPGNGTSGLGDDNTQTLVNLFEAKGLSWHAFCEEGCPRGPDHFGWTAFNSIVNSPERVSHLDDGGGVSTSDLVNAVGSFNFLWYTPTDNHNMHDNSVSSGDDYLSSFVPDILSKPAFTSQRTLLLLWWDEYDPAPFLILGPTVVRGLISSRNDIQEYTITKLVEENWGLASLASNDASQANMSEFFTDSLPPPGQPTNPPSILPTKVSDLWLILVGVVLGAVAGIAIFGVKSRHRKRTRSTAEERNDPRLTQETSSRRGPARRTKSSLGNSVSKGKLIVAVCYATLLIVGALAGAGSWRAMNVNAAASGRYFDNIVVVAMENQNYADVMGSGTGSPDAPYIASLLPQGATIPNYHGNRICGGGSENAYLQLTSGQDWGCPGNGARDIGTASTRTLVDLFEAGSVTWQAYCEGSCGRDGDHFPWIDYVSITSSSERMSRVDTSASTTQLINAVGSYNFLWYTPEDNHNMHDNSVSSGDSYLESFIPTILSKPSFTSGRSVLLLWWDEYDPAPFLMLGPNVAHGLISSRNDIQEYTITKLIEENWGLASFTPNDASQASMGELFGSATPGQLTGSFSYVPSNPVVGQTVTFTASAAGGTPGYSFSWNFGDGASGTGQTATHVYSPANGYQVTLTVHDSTGGTATATRTISISNPVPPGQLSADFTYYPSSPFVGQLVAFAGTASGGSAPYSFVWDLGDSSSDTGSTIQHSYSTSGSFTVTLTVTDNAGAEATTTAVIDIASQQNGVATSFSFRDPNGNDISSDIAWQVWDGSNLVATTSHASLNPSSFYELRIFYQGHLIVSEEFTAQPIVQNTIFMYRHNSAPNGHIVFNSTINSLVIDEESNSRLRFTAEGLEGPYTVVVDVPQGPSAVLKDGSDYPYIYDSGGSIVVLETSSLSSWELDFTSGALPPSLCPFCPPIPSSLVSSLWLVAVGSMIGLTASLSILTHRAHGRLQRARELYRYRRS